LGGSDGWSGFCTHFTCLHPRPENVEASASCINFFADQRLDLESGSRVYYLSGKLIEQSLSRS
jgi:hypothetical protein